MNIPGQVILGQNLISLSSPVQFSPPYCGSGLSQIFDRVLVIFEPRLVN